ncbi:MAG: response regulator [Clostridiales bacterium]|nr:response regulator [Clostridiales bacterium]
MGKIRVNKKNRNSQYSLFKIKLLIFSAFNDILTIKIRFYLQMSGGLTMNYTVLVVEDEYEQRRALIEMVDWAAAGFEVIGEAENGVEALDIIEGLEPDLILTDIKMPMISGLELAARVRELRPATQIVILSGYDSFEYARTAINYNIISYLLKPISSSEMSEKLFEIHERMDEKLGSVIAVPDADTQKQLHKLSIERFLLPLMLGSNEEQPDDEELARCAEELGIIKKGAPEDGATPRFCVLISKFKQIGGSSCTGREHTDFIDTVLSHYIYSFSFIVYGRVVSLIVTNEKGKLSNILELPLRETVQTAKRMLNQSCTIGVSREFTSLSGCASAYFQAVTARRYTSDGAGEVRFINDQERNREFEIDSLEKSVLKLEQLLKVGTNDSLEAFVNSFFEGSTPENANLLVVQIIATVYSVVSNVADDKSDILKQLSTSAIFARVTSYNSESGMKNELISFCKNAKEIINNSQKRESEILCDKVIEIINDRYSDEQLSLVGISNELAVSPNYLSALIKKTKKKNYITLLTERRMKAAYDMLVCSDMKVLEIAQKCGYSDQHYFSYSFKKFYGDSPNKVRTTNRKDLL